MPTPHTPPTQGRATPNPGRSNPKNPMRSYLLLSTLAVLALASCAATGLPSGQRVGEPMEPRDIEVFAVVDATPEAFFEQTLLVEATVAAVCQKAGCWMQVEDQGRTAMVRWETGCGGKYAFPPDLVGRRVVIQGSFYPKVISEQDIDHLQEESSNDIVIEREGYEFNASAILVLAPR